MLRNGAWSGWAPSSASVVGLLVHWVDSLATDVAYMGDFIRAVAYVVAFVVFMVGVGQLTTGRRWLLLGRRPIRHRGHHRIGLRADRGTIRCRSTGPSIWRSTGRAADPGVAVCTWAAGHEKVERINNRGTLPTGREYALDVDRGRLRIKLELDGGEYVALGSEAFDAIDGAAQDASLHLPLLQTLVSAPEGIPGAVDASIDWACQPAPPS